MSCGKSVFLPIVIDKGGISPDVDENTGREYRVIYDEIDFLPMLFPLVSSFISYTDH